MARVKRALAHNWQIMAYWSGDAAIDQYIRRAGRAASGKHPGTSHTRRSVEAC